MLPVSGRPASAFLRCSCPIPRLFPQNPFSPTIIPSPFSSSTSYRHLSNLRRSFKNQDIEKAFARDNQPFKTYKPVTPGLRHLIRPRNDHLWTGKPLKALTVPKRKTGGRNHSGRITVRHIGGGAKQRIRLVDFHRHTPGVHDVVRIEYDPLRSAHIALIKNRLVTPKWPVWSYILAPKGLKAGDEVQSFRGGIPDDLLPDYAREVKQEPYEVEELQVGQSSLEAGAVAAESVVEEGVEKTTTTTIAEAEETVASSPEHVQEDGRVSLDDILAEEEIETSENGVVEQAATDSVDLEDSYPAGDRNSLAMGVIRSLTIKPGNVLPLHLMPIGTVCHNISLRPEGPGVLVRAAGSSGVVLSFEANTAYAHVKLQSGEVRKLHRNCHATVGSVSNPLWKNRSLGKAGRSRWLGIRPTVRGVAMNKKDHPHGGGRGKSKSNKHPVSPWGWQTKGKRTRKPGKRGPKGNNKWVVKERPRGREASKRIN